MLAGGALRIGRPAPHELLALLDSQAGAELTYREVGASQGPLPDGYQHDRTSVVLGRGDEAFAAGTAALRRWGAHTGAGLDVLPVDAPLAEGQDVLVVLGLGPLVMTAACRIVVTVDRPDRFGFAYGSLPLHPETGEESFTIERDEDGTVRFAIVAFSRPSALLARLGGPVTRHVQQRTIAAYLEGLRRACR